MKKYTAVLFDLDGTLRASMPEGWEAFTEFVGRVGIALSHEQVAMLEREAHRYWGGFQVDEDKAKYDQRMFWINYNRLLLRAIGIENADAHAEKINDLYDEYAPVDMLFADARRVLKTLRERGYVVGLVSNREEDLAPLAEKYGFAEFFHFTLSGGQAGCYKPAPEIFWQALKLAGNLKPEQALYVGDNYFADVEGARNAGMDSILIDHRDVFAGYNAVRVKHLQDVLNYAP